MALPPPFITPATAIALAVALIGCTATLVQPAMRTAQNAGTIEAQLAQIYDQYFEEQLRLSPIRATYLGDDRYNDRLENPASEEYYAQMYDIERRYLSRVKAIPSATLQGAARMSYDVFVYGRELELAGEAFPDRLLPIDQMDNMALTLAVLGAGRGAQPFRNVRDYDHFLRRMDGFPTWVDSAIGAMRDGVQRGVVQPRVVMRKVIPQLRDIGVTDPKNSVFWQPVKNMPSEIPPAERARLEVAYAAKLGQSVLPAYRRLADFIEKEYLPHTRTTVAWTALPNGAAWYAHRIQLQTTTQMTADEIHRLGLAEVSRIRDDMDAVRRQVGFQGDLAAFLRHMQTDPKFVAKSADELLEKFRQLKKRVAGLLPAMFADFPKADYEVRPVEAFRARSAPGGFYQSPSADGKRPGMFYVNTFDLKAQPLYGVETLSLHEASPGHHFQGTIAQELTHLPRFQRFGDFNAYAEGWALYCESIGKELGLFVDPYQWFGRLDDENLRAMRLVVDTGLHTKNWTRDQAIEYMLDHSAMAATQVEAEVERYIAWPAQALAYKVGQLRITALRSKAQQVLGAKFDIKAFHSQVLRDGSLPLAVLEAKIHRWIRQ